MAFELHRPGLQRAIKAASAILPRQAVCLGGSSALHALPCATNSQRPFGLNGNATGGASGLNAEQAIVVYERQNYVKAIAAASVGVGAEVEVASSNGALGPAQMITASGHWAVGISQTPAAAGEVFTVLIEPRKA